MNSVGVRIRSALKNADEICSHRSRAFQGGAEARRGQVTVRYPDGSERQIWNTSNYYWLTRDGYRVGTEGPAPPTDVDITQALPIVPPH